MCRGDSTFWGILSVRSPRCWREAQNADNPKKLDETRKEPQEREGKKERRGMAAGPNPNVMSIRIYGESQH